MRRHSPEILTRLSQIDSPTLSNAIERFRVRPLTSGYAGFDLRCIYPKLGSMVGYAVTCTADSTTEVSSSPRGLFPLWEALEASPKPAVLVIKDIGPERVRSCHLGEVMATTAKALGAVGCVSDGGLRDILEIEQLGGFQLFCPGFTVSHGNPVICDINVDVELSGLQIRPGDLLHGDINGLLTVPDEVIEDVCDQVEQVRKVEAEILDLVRSPGFSVDALKELHGRFKH
ncbi:MAG: RraA family protein [Acidobacteriota bacterium]|nr:MAG: RraA family protein [Acidobacteriota bacterium]